MGKGVVAVTGVALALGASQFMGNVWYPGKYALDSTRSQINDQFDAYYGTAAKWGGSDTNHDETNNRDAAERYFTLTTDFLEWGWGDAFHMAPVKPGWSFFRSMAFWETVSSLSLTTH